MSAAQVQRLRYRLISQGWTLPHFHSSENLRVIRDEFRRLVDSLENFFVTACILRKRNVLSSEWDPACIYRDCLLQVVQAVLNSRERDVHKLILITDAPLPKSQLKPSIHSLRSELKSRALPFHHYLERALYEPNLQISDSIAWTIFQEMEKGRKVDLPKLKSLGKLKLMEFQVNDDHLG